MLKLPSNRILVAGASNPLARRTVELLLRRDDVHVTATSPTPINLVNLASRGARIARADLDDLASLDAVMVEKDRLLLVCSEHSLLQRHLESVVDAAARAGVRHIVYASAIVSSAIVFNPFAADHMLVEQAIQSRGIGSTILSIGWYAELLFARVSLALRFGEWVTCAPAGKMAYLPRDDAARAVVAVLAAEPGYKGRIAITGESSISSAELIYTINTVFGSEVKIKALSDEQFVERLLDVGLSTEVVKKSLAMEQASRNGPLSHSNDSVERLTGKSTRGLSDFLTSYRMELLLASKTFPVRSGSFSFEQ